MLEGKYPFCVESTISPVQKAKRRFSHCTIFILCNVSRPKPMTVTTDNTTMNSLSASFDTFFTNETPIAQHSLEERRREMGMRFFIFIFISMVWLFRSLLLLCVAFGDRSLLYFTFHTHSRHGWMDGYMGDGWSIQSVFLWDGLALKNPGYALSCHLQDEVSWVEENGA